MTFVVAVLVAVSVAGGVYWWHTSDAPDTPVAAQPQAVKGAFIGSAGGDPLTTGTPAPELADTQAPDGLHADARGHLIVEAANRAVFDYFLDVPASLPEAQRVSMAEAHLRAKLITPALAEAQSLLQHYLVYRKAAAEKGSTGHNKPTLEQVQQRPELIATLRQQLSERTALRRQYLGADVAQAWYADDDAMDAAALERLAVMADPSLTPEQRTVRIAAIDANLPPSVQQARRDASAPLKLAADMETWTKQGMSEAEMRQRLSARGVDNLVADRLIQGNREEADWRNRYDAYALERDRINAFAGLSDADRAAQIAQLRQQTFTASHELLRAQALDGLAQRK
ncbi:MAG: lipase secretion chaperone [Pseudomonadota bacterium]|uniref:lipase secretion chaperone n=1 Tax=Ralstonia pickettii TaxID=329 RepID=UPI0027147026|nr:lipase secretion chaperone [Ralstonia pickettii]MEE2977286.1 lipase secretion chaperone [Pseudomonadota bacterium]WKZ86060.1 lipase chaperone [Ralstonia pickettii]